jgi:hypothetical protein
LGWYGKIVLKTKFSLKVSEFVLAELLENLLAAAKKDLRGEACERMEGWSMEA